MEGRFYQSLIEPPDNVNSTSTLTLTNVNQICFVSGQLPVLGPNYFNWVGKMLHIKCVGITTSGATPGNMSFSWFWGGNVSNTGTQLAGVTFAWAASGTNLTFTCDLYVRCRAVGASGSLYCVGTLFQQNTGLFQLNPSAPAAVTCDLTQANYISPQINRTGSTAETWVGGDIFYEALN